VPSSPEKGKSTNWSHFGCWSLIWPQIIWPQLDATTPLYDIILPSPSPPLFSLFSPHYLLLLVTPPSSFPLFVGKSVAAVSPAYIESRRRQELWRSLWCVGIRTKGILFFLPLFVAYILIKYRTSPDSQLPSVLPRPWWEPSLSRNCCPLEALRDRCKHSWRKKKLCGWMKIYADCGYSRAIPL